MRQILPVCALLLAGAVSACASVDNGLLSLVPANAQLIVGIDVQKTRDSQFGQYMLSKSQAGDAHFQEFIDRTGFDPRRDLQNLMIVSMGNNSGTKGPGSFAVLARGVFDPSKILAVASAKDGVTETYNGVSMTVYEKKKDAVAVAFPQVGVAVMADLTTMQQILMNLSTPTSFSPDLTARINAIGGANDAWFVSTTGPSGWKHVIPDAGAGPMQGQAQALNAIRSASGGMKSGATVDISFDATARSAEDATSLADVFRFMASAVQMQRQQNAQAAVVAAAMDNMILTTSGSNVHIAFSIPEKSLEQLAESKPARH
jgi:hypothetical protein